MLNSKFNTVRLILHEGTDVSQLIFTWETYYIYIFILFLQTLFSLSFYQTVVIEFAYNACRIDVTPPISIAFHFELMCSDLIGKLHQFLDSNALFFLYFYVCTYPSKCTLLSVLVEIRLPYIQRGLGYMSF